MKRLYLLFCLLISVFASKGQDVGVSAITAPVGSFCNQSSFTVTVTIQNFGVVAVNGIQARFQVDAGAWTAYENVPAGTLLPGNSISYTFSATATIPMDITGHTITACTNLPTSGDITPGNDCKTSSTIINYPPVSNNIMPPAPAAICRGTAPGILTGSNPSGGNNSYTYQWDSSGVGSGGPWSTITGATSKDYTPPAGTQRTTWFRRRVTSAMCAVDVSAAVQVTIEQAITTNTIGSNQTICGGTAPTGLTGSSPTGGSGSYTYQWESSTTSPVAGFTAIPGATASVYTPPVLTVTTYYRRIVSGGACAANNSSAVTITVEQNIANNTVSSSQTICSGAVPAPLTGTAPSGGSGSYTYQWEISTTSAVAGFSSIGGATSSGYSPGSISVNTWYRRIVSSGVCASNTSAALQITVDQPTVAGSVSGGTNVCNGSNSGNLTLSGNTGSVLNWESSTDGGSTWSIIGNTTNTQSYSNLTVPTLYRVKVQNGVCASAYTGNASMTIDQPSVGGSIAGSTTVCSGSNSGSLTLSGHTGSILNWEMSTDGGSTWSNIANTSTNQNYLNLTVATQYHAIVKNGSCSSSASAVATISMFPASVGGTVSGGTTVCSGTNSGSLTLSGETGSVIRWEMSLDAGATWSNIANTTNTQNYNNVTSQTFYRAVVQNGAGCATANSSIGIISVDPVSVGGSVSGSASVCISGNSGSLTLSGNTGSVINWEYSTDGGTTWTSISNTSTTQNYNNLVVNTMYRAVVKSGTCSAATSSVATITIDNVSVGGSVSPNASVCSGSNSGSLTLSGETGSVVRWELSTDGGSTWSNISNTTNSQNYLNLTASTLYRAVVKNGSCSNANSSPATITVDPVSVGGSVSSNQTVCSGSNSGTLSLSGNTGSVQNWEYSIDGGATWTAIANTTNSNNFTNITQNTQYRAVVKSGTCATAFSSAATVTVDAASVGGTVSANTTVCSGSNSGSLNLSGETGSVIRWESSVDGGTTWSNIPNTTGVLNFTNITQTAQYRAVVKNGTCNPAASAFATVTVDAPSVGGTVSASTTVCSGTNSGTLTLGGQTGNVIRWEYSTDGGVTWTTVANTTTSYNYLNIAVNTAFRAVVQNGTCGTVNSVAAVVSVNQPSVGGTVSTVSNVCSGSNSGTLNLTGNTGSVIRWEKSVDGGSTWSAISNTTNSLSFTNLTLTTIYRAVVQNGVCSADFSGNSTVTVDPVSVGGSVGPDMSVCSGTNTGTLNLTGQTGSVIRWELSTDGGTSWSNIANTTTSFTFNNIPGTTFYRAVVQSGSCTAVNSSYAVVTVTSSTNGGTLSPVTSVVCKGSNASLTLSGHVGSVINWEFSTDGGSTWNTIATTATTLSYPVTQVTKFRVNVQSCTPAVSTIATVNVDQPTVGGSVSADASVCSGSNSGTLTLSGQTGSVTGWEYSNDGGSTWISLSNTTTSQNYLNLTLSTQYRAVVANGSCPAVRSNFATLTVDPVSVGGSLSQNSSVCGGANNDTLVLTGFTGNIVSWESSTDGGITWSTLPVTTSTYNYINLTTTTKFRVKVKSGVCSSAYSSVVTIMVSSATVGGSVGDTIVCAGSNGQVHATGYVGNIVNWEISTDGGATWTSINSTNSSIPFTAITQTSMFRVVVTSCTTKYSSAGTVTVNQAPVGGTLSGNATVCSGSNSGVLNLSGSTGNIVRWEYSINGGASWTSITNTTNTQNYSGLTDSTLYRVMVGNGICPVTYSSLASINVNKVSKGGLVNGSGTVCQGANAGLVTLTDYYGSITGWEMSTDSATWTFMGNTNNTQSYINLNQKTYFRAIVKSGVCSQAYSSVATISVTSVTTGGTVVGSTTVCSGINNGMLSLSGYTGNIIRWESSVDGTVWDTINNKNNFLPFINLTASTQYRALVQSCSPAYSSVATVNVDVMPVPGTLSTPSLVICSGSNTGVINLSGYTGNITRWEFSDDNGNSWIGINNTGSSQTYFNLSKNTTFRAVLVNGVCPAAYSTQVNLTAIGPVNPGYVSGGKNVCEGLNQGILYLNSYMGNIDNWEYSSDNGISWLIIPNTTDTLSYVNLNNTIQYRAKVSLSVCPAVPSAPAQLTVDSKPVSGSVAGPSDEFCQGSNQGTISLSSYQGVVDSWEQSTDGISWSSISNGSDKLQFVNAEETRYYRALVRNGACEPVYSNQAFIKVNPKPVPIFTNSDPGKKEVLFSSSSLVKEGKIAKIEWDFGDRSIGLNESATHLYDTPGQYKVTLKVTTDKGCMDTISHTLNISFDPEQFIISNLVTLNDNGQNDFWYVENIEKFNNEVHIFNRYGNEVFSASPYLNNWDCSFKGSRLPEGTYFYVLKIKDPGKERVYKGSISILK